MFWVYSFPRNLILFIFSSESNTEVNIQFYIYNVTEYRVEPVNGTVEVHRNGSYSELATLFYGTGEQVRSWQLCLVFSEIFSTAHFSHKCIKSNLANLALWFASLYLEIKKSGWILLWINLIEFTKVVKIITFDLNGQQISYYS